MNFKLPILTEKTKAHLLGALAGAVLISWAGFGAMGWKWNSQADKAGKKQPEVAVVAAYAKICNAQFRSAKDLPVRIAALEKTERWSRGDVLSKSGWATMSGSTEPVQGVAGACADLLIPEKA